MANKIQKGFEGGVDGVLEHTQLLDHILRTAKREQRSVYIALLDLRNAFGMVEHTLIKHSLNIHHVPVDFTEILDNIYQNSRVSIAVDDKWTDPISVTRGVLQGDPLSPSLFNVCMNSFLITINQKKMQKLRFSWGGKNERSSKSWLQYADNAVAISSDLKSIQQLIDLFESWCSWTGMFIRRDKCSAFAMQKREGKYIQVKPNISLKGGHIPTIEIGDSFVYLGRIFNFDCNEGKAKENLERKLENLLVVTDSLQINIQLKLKILSLYIHN
jgi:hypothetical protein